MDHQTHQGAWYKSRPLGPTPDSLHQNLPGHKNLFTHPSPGDVHAGSSWRPLYLITTLLFHFLCLNILFCILSSFSTFKYVSRNISLQSTNLKENNCPIRDILPSERSGFLLWCFNCLALSVSNTSHGSGKFGVSLVPPHSFY